MPEPDIRKTLLEHVFPGLQGELLQELADVASFKSYPPDSVLCQEHHYEDIFYIVLEGEVVYTKKMGDDDHILRHGGANDFFGEMALIAEDIGRSATVKTTRATTVLEIERASFRKILQESPDLVLALSKMLVHRMRENDRQAIAELRAQQQEIQRAYDALRKVDEQRHIFLDTLAHELRTPLTSVMGYMQLVRGGHITGNSLQMSLEKIGAGLDRMTSLINDLLYIQEKETVEPHFKRVNLRQVLAEVIERARDHAQEQHANLILHDEHLPEMNAEADGLMRAFWHLVDNAIKFSPRGGDVTVSAWSEDNNVIVEISDHGVGIDPAFMPRLFQRFERDEVYENHLFGGVGLGMPIVKRIIDIHHGSIDVESERGKGTKFIITLPVDARRATIEMSVDDAWVDLPD